jgi:hypothetical protein
LRTDHSASGLDVSACSSEDKNSGVIFAVNAKPEPVACSFQFAGFAGTIRVTKAEILGDTRNARQPEIINHWDNPERIKIMPMLLSTGHITAPAYSVMAVEWEGR